MWRASVGVRRSSSPGEVLSTRSKLSPFGFGNCGPMRAAAAIGLGERQREPAEIGQTVEQLRRDIFRLVPGLGTLRRADVLDELARSLLQKRLFIGEFKVHPRLQHSLDNRIISTGDL